MRLRQRRVTGDAAAQADLAAIEALLPAIASPGVTLDAMAASLSRAIPRRCSNMRDLAGVDAFDALRSLLVGDASESGSALAEPSIERLRVAIAGTTPRASALDLAVLLRQALRREERAVAMKRSKGNCSSSALCGVQSMASRRALGETSCRGRAGRRGTLGTRLAHHNTAARRRRYCRERGGAPCVRWSGLRGRSIPNCDWADPLPQPRPARRSAGCTVNARWCRAGGRTADRRGQEHDLPTRPRNRFCRCCVPAGQGVTLVIVPRWRWASTMKRKQSASVDLPRPLAYQGGAAAANATIAERIAVGVQGLSFASPEAACGALRGALRQAAAAGHLRAMVIDEAHLVDQWGNRLPYRVPGVEWPAPRTVSGGST